ncbi:hypothetical protein KY290_027166 [Solanum tuberosum]|uniref:Small ribosomal subunit protein eS4 central region domain-containing protein n=1 Tax=Solanum tuberosum TaxID=4113 RepID=A0ABQ7UET9_SOLTU|nr:hypothetical protein KY290_027166 [Solanum tuberosum]
MRLNAPKHWMLDKLGGAFVSALSLSSQAILWATQVKGVLAIGHYHAKQVEVCSHISKDVVSIPKTNENFRLLYDTKGRFRLHSVRDEESKFKLCKVCSVQFGQKGIPYLNTCDGRTIRYPDPLIKAAGLGI